MKQCEPVTYYVNGVTQKTCYEFECDYCGDLFDHEELMENEKGWRICDECREERYN